MRIEHTFGPFHLIVSIVADSETKAALSQLVQQGVAMSASLDRLTREVAESRTVTESAVTLLDGLAQQIRDLKDDPAALEALANDLDSQQQALAAKISENTPADTGGTAGSGDVSNPSGR